MANTEKTYTVYKIIDPRDSSVVYIGATSLELNVRLSKHLSKARHAVSNNRFCVWLRAFLAQGLRPIIEPIEVGIHDKEDALEREAFYIACFKLIHPIQNMLKNYE